MTSVRVSSAASLTIKSSRKTASGIHGIGIS
jgi:hypothetical protein